MRNRLAHLLLMAAPPVAFFLLLIAVWQLATGLGHVPSFLLPSPLRVGQAAWQNCQDLLQASGLTAAAALAGLAASLVVGMLVAIAFSQSAIVRRSFYPYAIFLQTVPSVALAPLVIIWFGPGFASVVVVAFIIALFPIITNATTGLLDLDQNLVELFAMSSASRRQLLFKLQLPNSIPYLIAGAKISCGLSVIGAIVGEFTAGYGENSYGLGYLIIATSGRLQLDYLLAATLAAMLLGVLMFATVSLIGDWILRGWHAPGSVGDPNESG
ncbi:MAG TPA: ABC transporter permease [Pirellulales bacterium]|nr:ABC transporter permease [Pirellulales bacterium]